MSCMKRTKILRYTVTRENIYADRSSLQLYYVASVFKFVSNLPSIIVLIKFRITVLRKSRNAHKSFHIKCSNTFV